MRNKFLGIGKPGYTPLRKLRTGFAALRYAVRHDFSITQKLVASVVVLAAAVGVSIFVWAVIPGAESVSLWRELATFML